MISKKTLGLLAGASVASMLVASGPAFAGQEFFGAYPNGLTIVTDTDFVILDTTFDSGGDVVNSASIGWAPVAFLVEAGANIDGVLINTSLATISAIRSGLLTNATATGLRIDGTAPAVENNGDITARALSNPPGSSAYAEAKAVEYDATGLANGVASLVNNDLISADADAFASYSSGATATAVGVGVDQYATGFGAGVGSSAVTRLTNDGNINVTADATAIATGGESGYAQAYATATGVAQYLRNAASLTGEVTNNSNIVADAYAKALATYAHSAYATASAFGVSQQAHGNGATTLTANLKVDNVGTIDVDAVAFASATDDYAEATAQATGIYQNARDAVSAAVSVTNDGNIYVDARADALGGFSDAYAYAIATGVDQFAFATDGVGSTASAKLTNTSLYSIDVNAQAFAKGTDSVEAYASASGVYQSVGGAQTASATVDNDGSIKVDALAKATATGVAYYAFASANAFGVYQTVTATNGVLSSAAAELTNTGEILVTARAEALNTNSEYATASATASGVYQAVSNVQTATALVDNTGDIHATAFAKADGYTYSANAYAWAVGVQQSVTANNATGSIASATVKNESLWSIDAVATASAFNESSADATASAAGVSQQVYSAQFASALVENTGSITADANAFASVTYTDAYADANAWGVYQEASGNYAPGSEADATVKNSGEILATSFARALATQTYGDTAYAYATVTGVYQSAYYAETASALVENTGDIHATATADASVDGYYAYAYAAAAGVRQYVSASTYADYGTASATVTNESSWSIDAVANAYAEASYYAYARAYATAVSQDVQNAYDASALVENTGSIEAYANADATATLYSIASAQAYAAGVYQDVSATDADGSSASAEVHNSGVIEASAYADANANYSDSAFAYATATGIYQNAYNADSATALVENTGTIHAYASANAYAYSSNVYASANAFGVVQYATANYTEGSLAQATVTNESLLSIDAVADAYAYGSYDVEALAYATGVFQEVQDGDLSTALVDNAGSILADSFADAEATYDEAFAGAYATGIEQIAEASTLLIDSQATATVYNDGTVTALAYAEADAWDEARAEATAYGVAQYLQDSHFLDATVENGGTIRAESYANADGYEAYAYAEAVGVLQIFENPTSNPMDAVFDNWGSINATAYAGAFATYDYDSARAYATGYFVRAGGDLVLDASNSGSIRAQATADGWQAEALAYGIYAEGETKTGTINNSGVIRAEAYADGATGTARAYGILDPSYETDVEITNSGLVSAYAEGPYAHAYGIVIDGFRLQPPDNLASLEVLPEGNSGFDASYDYAEIHNDGGTIIAGYTSTGSVLPTALSAEAADAPELIQYVERGHAIYTLNAPNQVLVSLTGNNGSSHDDGIAPVEDGYIFGNIQISDDDAIVVSDGKTWFDGIINDEVPYQGSLDIIDDGNLLLLYRNNGPSGAYVDNFFMDNTGTLGVEFRADPTYHPFISANEAVVDGRLNVVYQADLYDDLTVYHGVVSADENLLYGAFDEVTDNSALLITSQLFDEGDGTYDEIDVVTERIAFGDVQGLTKNQQAVGDAIENVYDDLEYGSPEFENLVAHLFTFDDAEYPIQLNSLAGAEFAQYLQSVIWSTSQLNRTVTQRMECDGAWAANMQTASIDGQTIQPVADVVAAPAGCFEPGRVSLWADVSGSWNSQDGDKNAPGYDEDQYSFLVGADYAFDESFYMGVAVGYLDSDMDFKWFGNSIDYDGIQLALYGGYDDTENYIRGILSYGNYNGKSHRYVSVEPSTPIDPSGSPDSDVFSFYGELGHRFGVGGGTTLTPFAGLSLAQGEIDSFTENDPQGTGAALHIHSSDGNSVASLLGLRLGGDWMFGSGVFTPDISVAWMHEFDDERQTVKASFADAPPGANFKVVGAKTARDSAVVNVGTTFGLTEGVDFSVIYDGRYSSDYSSSALIGRVGVKF